MSPAERDTHPQRRIDALNRSWQALADEWGRCDSELRELAEAGRRYRVVGSWRYFDSTVVARATPRRVGPHAFDLV